MSDIEVALDYIDEKYRKFVTQQQDSFSEVKTELYGCIDLCIENALEEFYKENIQHTFARKDYFRKEVKSINIKLNILVSVLIISAILLMML